MSVLVFSRLEHPLVDDCLVVHLRVKQLLVEVVLLLSDGVDALKVVHVLDGARAAARDVVDVACPRRGLGCVISAHVMLPFEGASLEL